MYNQVWSLGNLLISKPLMKTHALLLKLAVLLWKDYRIAGKFRGKKLSQIS